MLRSRFRRRISETANWQQHGGYSYSGNEVRFCQFVHRQRHENAYTTETMNKNINQYNHYYQSPPSLHPRKECSIYNSYPQVRIATGNDLQQHMRHNYHVANSPSIIRFSSYSNSGSSRGKSKRQTNYEQSGSKRKVVSDPFMTLGIVRNDTLQYSHVKRTFLKIAMKYHPDTTINCTDIEREKNKDLFVTARMAFESIIAGPNGVAILKTEADDYVEEEDDFEEWFKSETGYDIPFMDAATMKEVADMTETVGGGLDRDGGMWTLARMVTNTVKEGGDARSVLQLEAGVIRDRAINGILRRRRKR